MVERFLDLSFQVNHGVFQAVNLDFKLLSCQIRGICCSFSYRTAKNLGTLTSHHARKEMWMTVKILGTYGVGTVDGGDVPCNISR